MKICKNCATINKPEATTCVKCSMKGMLVDAPNPKKNEPAIKTIYSSCKNCGTNEIGSGSHCKKCNFPIPQTNKESIEKTSITAKVKRS